MPADYAATGTGTDRGAHSAHQHRHLTATTTRPSRPCRWLPPTGACRAPMSTCKWAASWAPARPYPGAVTPNLLIVESGAQRDDLMLRARSARPGLRRRDQGHRHRPCQRRHSLSRTDPPGGRRISGGAGAASCRSSNRSPASIAIRRRGRSAASSPSSAPRAASGRAPSPTTSAGSCRASIATDTVITDLDLAFGTAGLNFNQDGGAGIADALGSPDRMDPTLLDRMLTKCGEKLSSARRLRHRRSRYSDRCACHRGDSRCRAPERALRRRRRPQHLGALDQAHPRPCRRSHHHRNPGARQPAQRQGT